MSESKVKGNPDKAVKYSILYSNNPNCIPLIIVNSCCHSPSTWLIKHLRFLSLPPFLSLFLQQNDPPIEQELPGQ